MCICGKVWLQQEKRAIIWYSIFRVEEKSEWEKKSMEMEVDIEKKQQDVVKEKDLFKAAEEGEASTFEALSSEILSKALSLRNEDARSLLHVAASSGHSQVPFCPFSKGSLCFSFKCRKNAFFLHLFLHLEIRVSG